MKVKIKKVSPEAVVPSKATHGSAAYDITAYMDFVIPVGRSVIPSGFALEIPYGYEAKIESRSGIASKGFPARKTSFSKEERCDVDVLSGKIDSDYRGEIGVIVNNHEPFELVVRKGTRIAQLTIYRVNEAEFEECDSLSETDRGEGGFGHTGTDSLNDSVHAEDHEESFRKSIMDGMNDLSVTLGTDTEKKFAWCLRKVNGELMVYIHERKDGFSKFNRDDFVTAFPVSRILEYMDRFKESSEVFQIAEALKGHGNKEYAIGEEFEIDGVRLKCVEHGDGCEGCYFDSFKTLCTSEGVAEKIGDCYDLTRKDKTNVIFVKVEE